MANNNYLSQKAAGLLAALLLGLLTSCADRWRPNSFENNAALRTYVNDPAHGFVREFSSNGNVKMTLRHVPGRLLPRFSQYQDSLDKSLYFMLSLSVQGKELLGQLPPEQYSPMLQLLSFGMERYVNIKTDGGYADEPIGVYFQPTYNLTKSNDLLLVFDRNAMGACKKLTLKISEFGLGMGSQYVDFLMEDINYLEEVNIVKEDTYAQN